MSINGDWNITINTPMGQQQAKLSLSNAGGAVSGQMAALGNSQAIQNASGSGDNVSWSIDIQQPMPMTLTFNGVVSGNSMSGKVTLGAFGDSDFSGERA